MKAGDGGYIGTIYTEQEILNFLFSGVQGYAGAKALSDATLGVKLDTDTECKWVDIFAYGGILAIGNSTSVKADQNAIGAILTPGSTPYRIFVTNLSQIYVSGATGTRACYIYYV